MYVCGIVKPEKDLEKFFNWRATEISYNSCFSFMSLYIDADIYTINEIEP